jgi:hypothetical protein
VTKWLYTGFGLVTVIIEQLQSVITNNYESLTELHTPKVTVNYNTHELFCLHEPLLGSAF